MAQVVPQVPVQPLDRGVALGREDSVSKAQDALEYARRAAEAFRVGYAVWRVRKGTLRLLKRFPAPQIRRRA
jgi:hypothetical protein